MAAFRNYGCVACHNGVNLGGNLLQRSHMMDDYFKEHRDANVEDLGRYEITGNTGDRYLFRVPILRNVELTAPYLHDGSMATLEDAIEEMAEHQIGIDLDDTVIAEIKAFLVSLSGRTRQP